MLDISTSQTAGWDSTKNRAEVSIAIGSAPSLWLRRGSQRGSRQQLGHWSPTLLSSQQELIAGSQVDCLPKSHSAVFHILLFYHFHVAKTVVATCIRRFFLTVSLAYRIQTVCKYGIVSNSSELELTGLHKMLWVLHHYNLSVLLWNQFLWIKHMSEIWKKKNLLLALPSTSSSYIIVCDLPPPSHSTFGHLNQNFFIVRKVNGTQWEGGRWIDWVMHFALFPIKLIKND